MKVLLLGATGALGASCAIELARSDAVSELVVASRHADDTQRLGRLLDPKGRRVRPIAFDITNGPSLLSAVRACDVVASAAGPAHELEATAARACASQQRPYISLGSDDVVLEELYEELAGSRSVVVPGCGLSPGVTNLLVERAARALDAVDSISVSVGASLRDDWGAAGALDTLHDLGRGGGPEPGAHHSGTPRLVYCPEPVGWVETFPCRHAELTTLSRRHPGALVSYRKGFTERSAMDAIRVTAKAGLLRTDAGRRRVLAAVRAVTPALRLIPGGGWTAARVDVTGHREDRPASISLGVTDKLVNLASLTLAMSVLTVGEGGAPGGVRSLEEVVEPAQFLVKLGERGVRSALLEPEPL